VAPLERAVARQDPICDDDLQLALYICYELHYRSFDGVRDCEWDTRLLADRALLEGAFLERLTDEYWAIDSRGNELPSQIRAVIDAAGGPSLSGYMESDGTLEEMREFAMHRSAYQRKEADPHTWAIPRLHGEAKAALVRIQADEYGFGNQEAMHSALFADTMAALDLDPSYGAYLDCIPGSTLASVNLISLFGLHRRWRGALVGHLTAYEMTSVVPMRRYADTLVRLGVGVSAQKFYRAHVIADAEHQDIALHHLAGGLARSEPALCSDILFGVRAALGIEARFAEHLLEAWADGRTSLYRPTVAAA
jgi:Iron-containing redox enzyme